MRPPRIAVIDDDASLRDALLALFASVGWTGSGHGSAEAFLASREAETVDGVVTDLQLPGLSGIDLALRLRQAARSPPVIIVTARGEAERLDRARLTGAVCVLLKPFAAADLLACVEKALARRQG